MTRTIHPRAIQPTPPCRCVVATARAPGAIAMLQLAGDSGPVLAALTGRADWDVGCVRLVDLAGIDRGLAGRIANDLGIIMPHGGPRVVDRLVERLRSLDVEISAAGDLEATTLYPEAADEPEARMLAALVRARSPLAVDLLLDQPRRWRAAGGTPATPEDAARSRRLDRLIDPPTVVVAGPPNVGKSTLANALIGRALSITMDHPGTTRDYTAGLIDLQGLVVHWYDTPGLRATDDPIEREAIEIARALMAGADCLIALTDAAHDWPDLPRAADLRVASKRDLEARGDADRTVCALREEGLAELTTAIRDFLVPPEDITHDGPWHFDERAGVNTP